MEEQLRKCNEKRIKLQMLIDEILSEVQEEYVIEKWEWKFHQIKEI